MKTEAGKLTELLLSDLVQEWLWQFVPANGRANLNAESGPEYRAKNK